MEPLAWICSDISSGLPKMLPSSHLSSHVSLHCRTWLVLTHVPPGEAQFLKSLRPLYIWSSNLLPPPPASPPHCAETRPSSGWILAWHQAPPVSHMPGSQTKAATANSVPPSVRAVHRYTVKRDILVPPETQVWIKLSLSPKALKVKLA